MEDRRTEQARRRYDRIAALYDPMEALVERRYRTWRRRLWSLVRGPRVLEVGVGTGKNVPHYPPGLEITAIDLSPRMLERARRRAAESNAEVDLRLGDVQQLDFNDESFDEVVATFVFCSVPDPIRGLTELRRVLRPGGRLLLLEHVRAGNALVGRLQDLVDPLSARMTGVHVNRRTAANLLAAGFRLERDEGLGMRGIFRLFVATTD